MRNLLLLTLLLFSVNGFAFNWLKTGTSTDDLVTFYIDTNSIQKVRNLIYVWELQDFLEPQSIGGGLTMNSIVRKVKIGCDEFKSMPVVYESYSSNMGRGRLLSSFSAESVGYDKWIWHKPGQTGWLFTKEACDRAK